jgi:hypothetical protein
VLCHGINADDLRDEVDEGKRIKPAGAAIRTGRETKEPALMK